MIVTQEVLSVRNVVVQDKLTASEIKYHFFYPKYMFAGYIETPTMSQRIETILFEVSFLHLSTKSKILF